MRWFDTILTLADGTTLTFPWQADDAMHAVEQLTNDPALYAGHDVVTLIVKEADD